MTAAFSTATFRTATSWSGRTSGAATFFISWTRTAFASAPVWEDFAGPRTSSASGSLPPARGISWAVISDRRRREERIGFGTV